MVGFILVSVCILRCIERIINVVELGAWARVCVFVHIKGIGGNFYCKGKSEGGGENSWGCSQNTKIYHGEKRNDKKKKNPFAAVSSMWTRECALAFIYFLVSWKSKRKDDTYFSLHLVTFFLTIPPFCTSFFLLLLLCLSLSIVPPSNESFKIRFHFCRKEEVKQKRERMRGSKDETKLNWKTYLSIWGILIETDFSEIKSTINKDTTMSRPKALQEQI